MRFLNFGTYLCFLITVAENKERIPIISCKQILVGVKQTHNQILNPNSRQTNEFHKVTPLKRKKSSRSAALQVNSFFFFGAKSNNKISGCLGTEKHSWKCCKIQVPWHSKKDVVLSFLQHRWFKGKKNPQLRLFNPFSILRQKHALKRKSSNANPILL